jgi:hypothetical protein
LVGIQRNLGRLPSNHDPDDRAHFGTRTQATTTARNDRTVHTDPRNILNRAPRPTLNIGDPERIVSSNRRRCTQNLNVPTTTVYLILYLFEPQNFRSDLNLIDRVLRYSKPYLRPRLSTAFFRLRGSLRSAYRTYLHQTTAAVPESTYRPKLHLHAYLTR